MAKSRGGTSSAAASVPLPVGPIHLARSSEFTAPIANLATLNSVVWAVKRGLARRKVIPGVKRSNSQRSMGALTQSAAVTAAANESRRTALRVHARHLLILERLHLQWNLHPRSPSVAGRRSIEVARARDWPSRLDSSGLNASP